VLRTWGLYRVDQQATFGSFEGRPRSWELWGTRYYWVVAALAVAGAVVLGRRCQGRLWPLLSTVVLVCLTSAATYGLQRFRIAAEPSLLVLAGTALVAGAERLAGRPLLHSGS